MPQFSPQASGKYGTSTAIGNKNLTTPHSHRDMDFPSDYPGLCFARIRSAAEGLTIIGSLALGAEP